MQVRFLPRSPNGRVAKWKGNSMINCQNTSLHSRGGNFNLLECGGKRSAARRRFAGIGRSPIEDRKRRRAALRLPPHSKNISVADITARHSMDYTEFLQKPGEVLTLPYFEGNSVCDPKQKYRLRETPQPGWYRFRKAGRYLSVEAPVEPELERWNLKSVRGYVMTG